MSAAGALGTSLWRSFPVDLGWRNVVFALRTALAGVTALAIAYWLELQHPQWAILTVYLLAQPTAGAAIAKGAYRVAGTVVGACVGLVLLALYSQAPAPLVGSVALWLGLAFYAGARLRNYAAYGFMLAGYTALLVALEGAADPTNAWSLATDRTAEIVIGIACITAVSVLIAPRYAGVVLRESLEGLFADLARYGATALRPDTPFATFAALRRAMVEAVVKFDALRSYTVFEAPEMRADDGALRRMVREFLRVLAIARGLYVRLEDFRNVGAGPVLDRLRPAIDSAAATLERIAADRRTFTEPRRVRGELLAARAALVEAAADLEAMAGRVPFDPLADGLLVLHRAGDLLHGLSMVMASEAASVRAARPSARKVRPAPAPQGGRMEPALLALRSMLALILISIFWSATGWNQGFTAVSGLAIILFFAVNQDRPGRLGFNFLLWTAIGIAVAYAAMVFVLPYLEGYDALALFLVLALLPAGLMAGTPKYAWNGIALGGFIGSEIGTGNLFRPDGLTYLNAAFALLAGMAACLVLLNIFPVNSLATRGRAWATIMGRLLPEAARGTRPERAVLRDILAILADLLPRLSLDRQGEEDFLRGTLGAASTSLELGRLNRVRTDPDLPPEAAAAIGTCLTRFAAIAERLPDAGVCRAARVDEAEAAVTEARTTLAALPLEPGSAAARMTVRAGASLRFIADRFDIDRAFLTRSFGEE